MTANPPRIGFVSLGWPGDLEAVLKRHSVGTVVRSSLHRA